MVHTLSTGRRRIAEYTGNQGAYLLLVLLAALFAFEQTRSIIGTEQIVVTNVELLLAGTIGLWLLSLIVARRKPRLPKTLLLPALLWLGWLILSTVLASAHQDKALLFVARVAAGLLLAIAAYDLADTRERWFAIIVAMVFGGIVVAGLGLAEWLGLPPVVRWLDGFKLAPTRVGDVLRISATLSYATITAMVFELIVPLLLVLTLLRRNKWIRLPAAAALLLVLVAHVLTLSRAGVIAMLAALGLLAVGGLRRRQRGLVKATFGTAAVLIILVILVLTLNPTARLRLVTETERLWYQVQYEAPEVVQARPGEYVSATVVVTNSGARSWSTSGTLPFTLSYHLYDSADQVVTYDGPRSSLPAAVAPDETVEIQALIVAPPEPGDYRVEWDMVQEEVTWFSWKDAPTAETRLVVSGAPISETGIASSAPPTDIRVISPTPGRLDLWQAAWFMFVDHPVFGVGPDNFRWQYGAYAGVDAWDTGIHANNLYLEWLADTGLVGLLLFLWFSWRLAKMAWGRLGSIQGKSGHADRSRDDEAWLLTLAIIASLVAWYVHGFFDYFYEFTPTYVAFWLLVALLAGAGTWRRDVAADRL